LASRWMEDRRWGVRGTQNGRVAEAGGMPRSLASSIRNTVRVQHLPGPRLPSMVEPLPSLECPDGRLPG
jgi:hypothetical protein